MRGKQAPDVQRDDGPAWKPDDVPSLEGPRPPGIYDAYGAGLRLGDDDARLHSEQRGHQDRRQRTKPKRPRPKKSTSRATEPPAEDQRATSARSRRLRASHRRSRRHPGTSKSEDDPNKLASLKQEIRVGRLLRKAASQWTSTRDPTPATRAWAIILKSHANPVQAKADEASKSAKNAPAEPDKWAAFSDSLSKGVKKAGESMQSMARAPAPVDLRFQQMQQFRADPYKPMTVAPPPGQLVSDADAKKDAHDEGVAKGVALAQKYVPDDREVILKHNGDSSEVNEAWRRAIVAQGPPTRTGPRIVLPPHVDPPPPPIQSKEDEHLARQAANYTEASSAGLRDALHTAPVTDDPEALKAMGFEPTHPEIDNADLQRHLGAMTAARAPKAERISGHTRQEDTRLPPPAKYDDRNRQPSVGVISPSGDQDAYIHPGDLDKYIKGGWTTMASEPRGEAGSGTMDKGWDRPDLADIYHSLAAGVGWPRCPRHWSRICDATGRPANGSLLTPYAKDSPEQFDDPHPVHLRKRSRSHAAC